MVDRAERVGLLEQLEQWNKRGEYSRCIRAIEAVPEQRRGCLLTVKLNRVYNSLAVLGGHGEHGTDGEVDGDLIRRTTRLLESVRVRGENNPYWNAWMGYSCLMAYRSTASAYEYTKHWLALILDDPAAQKLVRSYKEYPEGEKTLGLDSRDQEEIVRKETPNDVKGGGYP